MIDCICGEKVPRQNLPKHVNEDHAKDAYKTFITNHFKNPDPRIADSWECTRCRHSKDKETAFLSEDTCLEHIKDEHLKEAVSEFADSIK